MMSPFNLPDDEFKVIGWVKHHRSDVYEGAKGVKMTTPPVEAEVVVFPKIRALAIQGHPEWMDFNSDFVQWCLRQVDELLTVEV